ncbi:MAG: ribonuclease T2 family protein [Hyphomicrobiaceae bacterium]
MTPWARARSAGMLALAALAMFTISVAPLSAQYGKGPGGRAPYEYQPPGRNEAGRFDYYALVLSWSPTFCASQRDRNEPQCNARDGRQYAFVLHGLWPQHERGWPQDCPTRDRPFVPRPTIDRMLDIMPSPRLVIHEYRKHGTCSGLSPDAYYDLARRLYAKVKIPPRFVRPNQSFFVTPGDLREEFLSANPTLKDESVAVACGGPGGRLREVRICFSREGEFRPCGRNEDARRLCSQPRMYVPPVRGGGGGPDRERSPLPGPLDRRI